MEETLIVRSWTFFVPGHWPTYTDIHERGNHFTTRALKRRWQATVGLIAKSAGLRGQHCESIHINYRHQRKDRRSDKSNLAAAAMKIVEDALVEIGVIDDDAWSYVTGFGHQFQLSRDEGLQVFVIDQGERQQ